MAEQEKDIDRLSRKLQAEQAGQPVGCFNYQAIAKDLDELPRGILDRHRYACRTREDGEAIFRSALWEHTDSDGKTSTVLLKAGATNTQQELQAHAA
jgi:hypothetical protein